MTPRLRLVPTADVATLGQRCYLFDRAAQHDNVVSVPTQRISRRLHEVFRRIKSEWPAHEPRALEDFEALFKTDAERALVHQLVQAGYLEPVGSASAGPTRDAPAVSDVTHFREQVLKHFLKPATFFNLPTQIEDAECEVAIVGVPVSSTLLSSGTVDAPSRLRRDTQRAGFWFDFHARGVYTETGCDGTAPRLLCAGIGLKDCGDIGGDARTVGDLFAQLSTLLESRLLPAGVRPLFIGGDHAITFPVVDSLLRHYPDLVLIHLDAHNDLFYTERVEFNHAGPIHALLAHSGLGQVLSFGLRTTGDPRVDTFQRLLASGIVEERVRLYSLPVFQRWLARPEEFRTHLRTVIPAGAPVYLTIDLDVLSSDAIAGQLSTPAGPGLDWHQLLETTVLVCDEFDVVGADVVEFNPDHKNRAVHDEREMTVLLLELIDGLARARRRAIGER
jgi:arginase family enzyme